MKSKNDSLLNNSEINIKESCPSNNEDSTNRKTKIPSNDTEEKNIQENQEDIEQQDFNDFNIAFFLPKDLRENIEEDEETPENENKDIHQDNNFYLSKEENINDKDLHLNKINSQNIISSSNNKNNENDKISVNNGGKDLKAGENLNTEKNISQSNKNINNINNYFVNNNNNTQINFHFNNALYNNNFIYPSNNSDSHLMNWFSTNQPFYIPNNLINQNINNNYIFNNNIYPYFAYQNQLDNKNPPLFQVNSKYNNKQKKKNYNSEYIIEMFGRLGWICELCNNFNYETRKKCNRCHTAKKPKKIDEYIMAKMNNSLKFKNYWICKYCRNYNFPFRLVCNRCQAKKEV